MIPRPSANACVPPALQISRPERASLEADPVEQQDPAAPACTVPVGPVGCCAIATELYPVAWPCKFKPDLPHVTMAPKTRLSSCNSTR